MNQQEDHNWEEIKSVLQDSAGIDTIQSVYQYVGISASPGYSPQGTSFIENQMRTKLQPGKDLFLYGATGCSNPQDPSRANINGCLNRVLDESSLDSCRHVFANVVDASKDVIEKYGASISQNVRNIIYTYGTNEYETQFGDDNFVADSMTDVIIDYSGGPQSLAQVVDVLVQGKKAITVSGVRSQRGEEGFSSTGFLLLLKNALEAKYALTDDEFKQLSQEYSASRKIEIKWDSHTKPTQLQFAFTKILKFNPENIISNLEYKVMSQPEDRLGFFSGTVNKDTTNQHDTTQSNSCAL